MGRFRNVRSPSEYIVQVSLEKDKGISWVAFALALILVILSSSFFIDLIVRLPTCEALQGITRGINVDKKLTQIIKPSLPKPDPDEGEEEEKKENFDFGSCESCRPKTEKPVTESVPSGTGRISRKRNKQKNQDDDEKPDDGKKGKGKSKSGDADKEKSSKKKKKGKGRKSKNVGNSEDENDSREKSKKDRKKKKKQRNQMIEITTVRTIPEHTLAPEEKMSLTRISSEEPGDEEVENTISVVMEVTTPKPKKNSSRRRSRRKNATIPIEGKSQNAGQGSESGDGGEMGATPQAPSNDEEQHMEQSTRNPLIDEKFYKKPSKPKKPKGAMEEVKSGVSPDDDDEPGNPQQESGPKKKPRPEATPRPSQPQKVPMLMYPPTEASALDFGSFFGNFHQSAGKQLNKKNKDLTTKKPQEVTTAKSTTTTTTSTKNSKKNKTTTTTTTTPKPARKPYSQPDEDDSISEEEDDDDEFMPSSSSKTPVQTEPPPTPSPRIRNVTPAPELPDPKIDNSPSSGPKKTPPMGRTFHISKDETKYGDDEDEEDDIDMEEEYDEDGNPITQNSNLAITTEKSNPISLKPVDLKNEKVMESQVEKQKISPVTEPTSPVLNDIPSDAKPSNTNAQPLEETPEKVSSEEEKDENEEERDENEEQQEKLPTAGENKPLQQLSPSFNGNEKGMEVVSTVSPVNPERKGLETVLTAPQQKYDLDITTDAVISKYEVTPKVENIDTQPVVNNEPDSPLGNSFDRSDEFEATTIVQKVFKQDNIQVKQENTKLKPKAEEPNAYPNQKELGKETDESKKAQQMDETIKPNEPPVQKPPSQGNVSEKVTHKAKADEPRKQSSPEQKIAQSIPKAPDEPQPVTKSSVIDPSLTDDDEYSESYEEYYVYEEVDATTSTPIKNTNVKGLMSNVNKQAPSLSL